MRILAIESAAASASAAVVEDGKIIGEVFLNNGLTHSQTLMPMIEYLLVSTGTKKPELIAVSAGPGSFTGVRIGIASAKGLAFTDSIPCAQISSLEVLAYNYFNSSHSGKLCALMDARCGRAYRAWFSLEGGKLNRLTEDACLDADEIFKEAEPNCILTGDYARTFFEKHPEHNFRLAPEPLLYQRASSAAFAAISKKWTDCDGLQPIYLQLPQAQRELNQRLKAERDLK